MNPIRLGLDRVGDRDLWDAGPSPRLTVVREFDNHPGNDSPRRRLAVGACVEPIVECIRNMRVEGLADNDIAALFRQAADELDAGKVDPGA